MQEFLATKGITKAVSAMTQQERVLYKTQFILEKSTLEMGDFARTSQGWANQSRSLGQSLKDVGAIIGTGLVTAFLPVLQLLNRLIPTIKIVATQFRDFMNAVFGGNTEASSVTTLTAEFAKLTGNQEDSTAAMDASGKAVGKAGKKAKGALAGFDQLNVLTQQTADNMAAAAGTDITSADASTGSAVDTSGVDAMKLKVQGLKDTLGGIGKYFSDTFGDSFKTIGSMFSTEGKKWWNSLQTAFSNAGTLVKPLADFWTNSLVPAINKAIPQISTTLGGLSESARMVFDGLVPIAQTAFNSIITNVLPVVTEMGSGLVTVGTTVIDGTKEVFDKVWIEAIEPGLTEATRMLDETLVIVKKNWDEWGPGLITGLQESFEGLKKVALNLWDTYLKPGFDSGLKFLTDIWDNGGKQLVDKFLGVVGELAAGAIEFYNKCILPMVDGLVNTLGPIFKSVWEGILAFFGPVIKGLIGFVSGIFDALLGFKEFLLGVFTGDWKRAWEGIKAIFKGFFDGIMAWAAGLQKGWLAIATWLGGVFKGLWEKAWNGIVSWFTTNINKVRTGFDDVKKFISGVGDWLTNTFTKTWRGAWDGISGIVSTIGTTIQSNFKGVVNGVIKGINFMIKALNGLNIKMPDWIPGVGGQTAGFSIPEIPMLAKGGLAYSPQLAMVGDNRNARNDPEVVAPLSKLNNMVGGNTDNTETNDLLRQVLKAIQNQNLSIKIGESEFGRAAIKSINNVQRQAGSRLLIV
jgi:phage-related protein